MALSPGTRIGAYELVGVLGAGGMGEVYRARDTRLGRDVAIKVLPEFVSSDRETLARFAREATILASLNHPNIAHVYGFEQSGSSSALVMELIDGDDLSGRLDAGPMSVDEVKALSTQIIDALAVAHEQGIVHRDLKPGNIKLRRDGIVKVLDFGLAKPAARGSDQATMTRQDLTEPGVIVGTPAYMSPEQIAGDRVDARTDVWAFGCVLFEMLSGRKAFAGKSGVERMSAVLKSDPDWRAIVDAPVNLQALVRRCLQKDVSKRLGSIADAKLWLEDTSASQPATQARSTPTTRWMALAASLIAVAAIGYAAWLSRPRDRAPAPLQVLQIAFDDQFPMTGRPTGGNFNISPDGRTLIYHALSGDTFQLIRRQLDSLEAIPIPGSERAQNAVFSPDGSRLAFFSRGAIRTLPLRGGTPSLLCEWHGLAFGIAWTDDDFIWLTRPGEGVFRVPATGGTPALVYKPDASKGEGTAFAISPIPGGAVVVYLTALRDTKGRPKLIALRPGLTEPKTLIDDAMYGSYAAGHLFFLKDGALRAVPFDAQRLAIAGDLFTILEKSPNEAEVSDDGMLVYLQNGVTPSGKFNLNVRSHDGRIERTVDNKAALVRHARVSPDGRSLLVAQGGLNNGQIWRYALQSDAQPIRLASGPGTAFPIWSPDGKEIVFQRAASIGQGLFSIAADGSATEPERLLEGDDVIPEDWSPDGKSLLFQSTTAQTGTDLMLLDRATGKQRPWLQTPNNEAEARVAPGGRWVTYVSDQTGRAEVWVRAFDGGAPVRVSADGGHDPRWSPNGKTIYFSNGTRMMAADVSMSPALSGAPPRQLFEGGFIPYNATYRRTYDVTADDRFLVVQTDAVEPNQPLVVVLNAFRGRAAAGTQ